MNYRHTRNYENLQKRIFDGVGEYGIPKISPVNFKGNTEFIGFHQAARCKNRNGKSIHFFIDDYRFIRIWSSPDRYIDMLTEFDYVMSPDFSTYTDFPKAVQIYNHYRKHIYIPICFYLNDNKTKKYVPKQVGGHEATNVFDYVRKNK